MRPRSCVGLLLVLGMGQSLPRVAGAQSRLPPQAERARHDGVYQRFDGDLDLGLGLGAEFGSAGRVAPTVRGSAHYFSIAGVYAMARFAAGERSAPSLWGAGVDLRPLFVPRWAKGFETGPSCLDLTLDSLSLSLGAFWQDLRAPLANRQGFDVQLGFGLPLLGVAAGPWLEARGALRYPDSAAAEQALLVALAWHGFVTTPFSAPP